MLFLIFLILTLIFCFSAYFLNENDYDGASTFAGVLGTVTGIITVIMILIIAITWVNIPSTEAKWHQQYKDLNYQIDNQIYGYMERNALVENIIEWNADFAEKQIKQDSFWVSIFHPENLGGLDIINLERVK